MSQSALYCFDYYRMNLCSLCYPFGLFVSVMPGCFEFSYKHIGMLDDLSQADFLHVVFCWLLLWLLIQKTALIISHIEIDALSKAVYHYPIKQLSIYSKWNLGGY